MENGKRRKRGKMERFSFPILGNLGHFHQPNGKYVKKNNKEEKKEILT